MCDKHQKEKVRCQREKREGSSFCSQHSDLMTDAEKAKKIIELAKDMHPVLLKVVVERIWSQKVSELSAEDKHIPDTFSNGDYYDLLFDQNESNP